MSISHFILLVETDPALTDTLTAQLVRLGIEPIRVAGLDEAVDVIKSKQYAVCAVVVPSTISGSAFECFEKSLAHFANRSEAPATSVLADLSPSSIASGVTGPG